MGGCLFSIQCLPFKFNYHGRYMNYKALQQQAAAAIVQSWSLKIKLIEHDPQDQDQYMILEPSCVAEDENGTICLRGIVRQCVINVVGGCNNFPIANIS